MNPIQSILDGKWYSFHIPTLLMIQKRTSCKNLSTQRKLNQKLHQLQTPKRYSRLLVNIPVRDILKNTLFFTWQTFKNIQKLSLTFLDIFPKNCHVFVSVWSSLFVEKPKTVHHFMADDAFLVAPNSKRYQLRCFASVPYQWPASAHDNKTHRR